MSKLINISSLRNGIGRTTVTCLIVHKLAEQGYKTLLIDNNYKFCDLANYLLVEAPYNLDNIIPFVRANTIDKETLKSVFVPVEKNLELLAGSKLTNVINTLNKENVERIKSILDEDYDFIVIDNRAGIEHKDLIDLASLADISLVVTQANKHDKIHFENLKENLDDKEQELIKELLDKSYAVFNKALEEQTYSLSLFPQERIFKINHSSKLLDFCNGYKCNIFTNNESEINYLVSTITKKEVQEKEKRKSLLFKNKIKTIFESL